MEGVSGVRAAGDRRAGPYSAPVSVPEGPGRAPRRGSPSAAAAQRCFARRSRGPHVSREAAATWAPACARFAGRDRRCLPGPARASPPGVPAAPPPQSPAVRDKRPPPRQPRILWFLDWTGKLAGVPACPGELGKGPRGSCRMRTLAGLALEGGWVRWPLRPSRDLSVWTRSVVLQ